MAALSDDAYEELFFGGRGRSKGKGKGRPKLSSGKGKGRRTNPRGKNGSVMECFDCGSTFHLQKDCPGKGAGKGNETTLTGLVEYHDLAQFNELEGIYFLDYEGQDVAEFEVVALIVGMLPDSARRMPLAVLFDFISAFSSMCRSWLMKAMRRGGVAGPGRGPQEPGPF